MSSKSVDQSTHDDSYDTARNYVRRALTKFFFQKYVTFQDPVELLRLLKELQQDHAISVALHISSNAWMDAKAKTNSYTLSVYYAKNPNAITDISQVPSSKYRKLFNAQGETTLPVKYSFNGEVQVPTDNQYYTMSLEGAQTFMPDRSSKVIHIEDSDTLSILYLNANSRAHRHLLPSRIQWNFRTGTTKNPQFHWEGKELCSKEEATALYKLPKEMKEFEFYMRSGDIV